MKTSSVYDKKFYEGQREGADQSARIIVPRLLARFDIASVIDVGCGVGSWLAVFRDHGVEDIIGVDGDYVDQAMLCIPADRFVAADISKSLPVTRCFDMALCLEVAEHIAKEAGDVLVERLTSLAPVVAFSAAIPGQGGTGHINEQWQDYWRVRFLARGFHPVDLVRPGIWGNAHVKFWYQQNLICYCSAQAQRLAGADPVAADLSLNLVHPVVYEQSRAREVAYLSAAVRRLPELARKAVRRRLSLKDQGPPKSIIKPSQTDL